MHPKHALLTVPYRVLRRSSSISLPYIAAVTLLTGPAAGTPILSISSVATPGRQQVSASDAPKSLPHPGLTPAHSDTLESASLTATVVTSFPGLIDDINGFTFQTMAVHTPEPTLGFLVAIGCVLLFAYGRRTI